MEQPGAQACVVRPAQTGDIDALVALRQENGRVHARLDPAVYRVPEAAVVRAHFEEVLAAAEPGSVVLVATDGAEVLGMVEVSLGDPPPEHQVLRPTSTARLHVVVAPQARGRGVGTALEQAAGHWASARGARELVAGIQSDNEAARRFYGAAGYRDQAVVLIRDLGGPATDPNA